MADFKNSLKTLTERVIITDDPLRGRMLAAHHLECCSDEYNRGDIYIFNGSYAGVPVAVISSGFGCDELLACIYDLSKSGVSEVIYISTCISSTCRYDARSVILAAGGSRKLMDMAHAAAARCDIKTYCATVLSPADTQPEEGCITDEVTSAFYKLAVEEKFEALSLLTVSENTSTGTKMEINEIRSRLYPASRLVFEIFSPC